MKKTVFVIVLAFVSGLAGAWVFQKSMNESKNVSSADSSVSAARALLASYHGQAADGNASFVLASKVSTPSVVFIKTTALYQQSSPFGWMFDEWDPFGNIGRVSSTGSGVIVRKDGYIVTNLHVVKDASTIEVVLNNHKKSYTAKMIGSDPSTDLALLKIEASDLPAIQFGNSDNAQIGEWVIAVGNPFNLTSTVTAGIISAKGRNINIVNNQFPIESFIQTDAAINPGNSGGALVNLSGELIGINTAIYSKTGSYNGYGFAIPVNIVTKTVKDLIDFGEVQRGFTGMEVTDIDESVLKELNQEDANGAYVAEVSDDGPAAKAGIRAGDVIIKVQDKTIDSKATLDEHIAYYRPADKIKITYLRKSEQKETTLTLINRDGELTLIKNNSISSDRLGADFSPVSKLEAKKYGITKGVKVTNLRGGLIAQMGIPDGFIFTKLNGKECSDAQTLIGDMEKLKGRIQIEGIGPDGGKQYFNFY